MSRELEATGVGEYSFRHFLGLELEGTGAGEYRDPTFLVVVPAFLVVVLAREQHAKDFSTRLTPDASGDVQQDFAECLGMRSQDLDTSLCQSFCTSKGLDLSGIVGGKVHYYFEVNTDQTRKEAFREATATYHRWTCIRFVEVERSFTGAKLGVGNYDSMSCNARAGYSSYWNRFNLGSCMNLNHMGEILHNLGHVLGMLDEQKRPDAARNVWGHGPHLQVFWDNVPTNWRPYIFNPVEDAYTGSATRNPWAGNYAPYDFDSIMHFHPMLFGSQIYETIPSVQMRNVGQRNSLSEGDILQLLDSY
ncbi:TLL1, partial [Symbiodinium sp. KB8]